MRYFITFLFVIFCNACATSASFVYEGENYNLSSHTQLGEIDYVGTGNILEVEKSVSQHIIKFERCHQVHSRNRITVGKVKVKYIVKLDGTVLSAYHKEGTNVRNPGLRNCVVETFRNMKFSTEDLNMNSWILWVHQEVEFSSVYYREEKEIASSI